jgi:hypothetical protein
MIIAPSTFRSRRGTLDRTQDAFIEARRKGAPSVQDLAEHRWVARNERRHLIQLVAALGDLFPEVPNASSEPSFFTAD